MKMNFKHLLLAFGISASVAVGLQAEESGLLPLEEARLRVFDTLYQNDLKTLVQKRNFLKKNFKTTNEYDIYTFPNQKLESAYKAYADANLNNGIGTNILHKDLPKTNKAFKVDSTKENPLGYVLMYIWNGNSKLTITATRLDGENLCAKEVLEFEQKANATTLKSSFEQY
ncbi:hypothetical protein CQA53_04490 [Helicobacter didelphidarum]|uniref:Uncharacterized protein n=1 Tax=Helicobacter didelphidarum TaxID=2040648 RepID=A0A3D8ILI2_9HELI|nr:hypothetical protein [Helicobacter didelphidarum]RDU66068.1 hypothetical protein CQA53_04490 [Helicobacter didelphidarum]